MNNSNKGNNIKKKNRPFRITVTSRAVVAHTFNPSTQEAEAGRFLSSRPAWSTESVPEQPELHRETLSQNNNNKK
jgi:major histocompatibility complex class I